MVYPSRSLASLPCRCRHADPLCQP